MGKVGARLQVHPTSVTNLIDGLEHTGLVERAPHPSDRRTTLATITSLGRERADVATDQLHAIRFGTASLSAPDLQSITDILRTVRVSAADFSE